MLPLLTRAAVALLLMPTLSARADSVIPFTRAAFDATNGSKGVVLVSANWSRRWKCGAYENAQLQSLGFDRVGAEEIGPDEKPDLILEDSSWLPTKPTFVNFALLVEPGRYLLSAFKVKAAMSVGQVGFFNGDRTTLIAEGNSKAGSFSVAEGEVVYIGHFALDCAQAPMPWRYYPEDKDDFSKYLQLVQKEFPGLPTQETKFRLFETTAMGNPFTLK